MLKYIKYDKRWDEVMNNKCNFYEDKKGNHFCKMSGREIDNKIYV